MSLTPTQNGNHFRPLTVGILGFGNFGQFLGATFAKQGHRVIGCSRADYAQAANAINCEYVRGDVNVFMDHQPDVVILCTSIMSLHSVLSKFPLKRLSNVLVVDVLSVKMYPHDLLLKCLPETSDILCTHPMFGPESGKTSWQSLPFVYDIVRVTPNRMHICNAFLQMWSSEGCKMVPMDCAVHDSFAASTQFLTHTTGRMLMELDVESTPINTRGYESLLGVVDTTRKDSFDLFYGLYKYNPNAKTELEKLEIALRNLRTRLQQAEDEEAESKKRTVLNGMPMPTISETVLEALVRRTNQRRCDV